MKTSKIVLMFIVGAYVSTVCQSAQANNNPLPPIYVKASATGNKDGTSWKNAYTTVASGVAAAIAQGGGEVRIAAGVYAATSQISISGDNSITVKGGYPGIDDNEDDDVRDPELYQSIMTADSGTQASTYNHLVPTEDGTFYNATNTTIKIVENGRVNLPEKYHCGLYDTFYPNRANKVTGYAFSANSAAPFELDGVWIVARGSGISAAAECKSLIVRNCNFVGCDEYVYSSGAAHNGSFPRRYENCKILYSSGYRMKLKGGADFVNCVFRGNMITSGGTTASAFYLWAGARTRFVGCEFSRYYRYVPASADVSGMERDGNIVGDEQSSGASFTDCVFSNNLSSSKNSVGITMLSAGDIRFNRCCFEKNRTVVNPSAGRTYTGLFLSNVKGGFTDVKECYFADNEVSAPVNNVEGNFNLALIGGGNGDAGMVLNSSFVSNRVFWADNGMSTVYASRGVFTSGGNNGQRAIVNCAFVGPGDDVYDVLQYGDNHKYITRVHNSIFVRTGEKRNPFYFGTPAMFSVWNTSIANFVNVPENLNISGLEIDEVPLEKIYTNNLPTLRPKARMPSMRTAINVATNTASYLRFKSPTATTWTVYLNSAVITDNNNKKPSASTPLPIIDACGEARPFDSFTRGPVQTLSDEAESARTIVIRANPSGAAVFSPSHVQVVQSGGMSAPVSFTPVDNISFAGWYTNDGLVSTAETLPSFEVAEDVVIEARYTVAPIEITYDLGQCGVFSEGGKSSLTVSAIPNTKFPATPLYTESDDWLFVSWSPNVPEQVPWTNVSFTANYISKDLRIVHVVPPEEVPEGSDGTGSSWENAVGDIPEAYRMAGAYRGEVWLKRGTYTPAGAMMPRSNVAIRGGFAGNETSADAADPVANPTIIDGKSTTTDFIYTGQATNCVIEGVTIKRFVNNAIRLTGSSTLYLRNCTIESIAPTTSTAAVNPKPVWVYGGIIAENCIFKANARNIYISTPDTPTPIATNAFLNCQFINNRFSDTSGDTKYGSTIFSAGTIPIVISNCVFSGNSSSHYDSAPVIRYACDSLVIDSRFEGNEAQYTARAPIHISGGKHLFIRCSFETNKVNTSTAYYYPSVAAVVYQAGGQTMFRDCLFRGNTAPAWGNKAYADNQGSASVLAVNGSLESTFVNCTIEGNSASATATSGSAATILGNTARIALVNCIVRNNTIGTGAAYSGEFGFGGGTSGSTFALINSVVQSQSSDKIFMAPSAFRPCVVSSVIEGADLDALAPINNSYMINASNAEAKFEKKYRIIPPTPPMAVVAPDFAAKHRGVPIWLATNALVYFYDTTPGLAKPWRKVTDKSAALDDAKAAEIGLARDNSPIPDANGAPRRLRKVRLGPVNPRNPGFTIHVR